MEIARTLDTLIDIQEDRLLTNTSVEAVLRITVDRKDGIFRAKLALSDGSRRCTAAADGAYAALAVNSAATKLQRRLVRRR
ncbi:MAG: hypothetical protein JRG91_05290 [Deltaproteobacteria bacterium]|nr:hypothetical protein [Deltaproteobacteria bacterium]